MTELDTEQHVNVDQMVKPVAANAGVSQAVARKVVRAFCRQLNEELAAGRDVALPGVGRFNVKAIKSFWRTNLAGERVAQKRYRRIYFKASDKVMSQLNKHLRG